MLVLGGRLLLLPSISSGSNRSPLLRQMLYRSVQQAMTSGTQRKSTSSAFKMMDLKLVFGMPIALSTIHVAVDR